MDLFKIIFSGRLEFSNESSFNKVVQLYEHRFENYYRNFVILEAENIFNDEEYTLDVPRTIVKEGKKKWANTVNLLKQVAEFATGGCIDAWMIHEGKILAAHTIEPHSDKTAVKTFLKGRRLITQKDQDEAARQILNKSISKFEKHSKAYERRGFVNYRLGNYEDALYDYSKSIRLNEKFGQAYLGRAFVHHSMENYADAITDLEIALKNLMPIQVYLYFHGRRLKADCHLILGEKEAALEDLLWFNRRKFTEENGIYKWLRRVYFTMGQIQGEFGEKKAAEESLNKALTYPKSKSGITDNMIKTAIKQIKKNSTSAKSKLKMA